MRSIAMSTVLYSNFLNDPEEYARAESFWKHHWERLLSEVGQKGTWQSPWFNTTFANGTPFRDGNPIFTAVCTSRRLGVQIIQLDPTEDDLDLPPGPTLSASTKTPFASSW
jgi:hypothetical protein